MGGSFGGSLGGSSGLGGFSATTGGSSGLGGFSPTFIGSSAGALAATISTLKEWKTSWPDLSLTLRMTLASPSAKSAGTFQRTTPADETLMPAGPESSLYLTPPCFDLTATW